MSTKRSGPPKHQNKFAWKPNLGIKINETEVGGRLRPLSEITGVCARCKGQIDWKRRYGKYKGLTEPAKCQGCTKRAVRQAYHTLCPACAKEQNVCAKCRCHVDRIIGKDLAEVESEQRELEEAIRHAREREKRTLLRAMNKSKADSTDKGPTTKDKVGDLFPTISLEEYARLKASGVIPSKAAVHKNDDDDDDGEDDFENDDGNDSDSHGTDDGDDDDDDHKDED